MRAVVSDKREQQETQWGLLQVESRVLPARTHTSKGREWATIQCKLSIREGLEREHPKTGMLLLQDKTTTDFEKDRVTTLLSPISGGHSAGVPPVPIPNTVVKPTYADDTRGETCRENRSPPEYL